MPDSVRCWLVQRRTRATSRTSSFSCTRPPTGRATIERSALTSFEDARETTAAIEVSAARLGEVTDPVQRDRYETEATRMRSTHDPDDVI